MKGICPFKMFKDIAGKPGTGIHNIKWLNIIIIDNLITIVFAMVITNKYDIPFPLIIIGTYIAGILMHMLFGVQTQTLTYLGIQC